MAQRSIPGRLSSLGRQRRTGRSRLQARRQGSSAAACGQPDQSGGFNWTEEDHLRPASAGHVLRGDSDRAERPRFPGPHVPCVRQGTAGSPTQGRRLDGAKGFPRPSSASRRRAGRVIPLPFAPTDNLAWAPLQPSPGGRPTGEDALRGLPCPSAPIQRGTGGRAITTMEGQAHEIREIA